MNNWEQISAADALFGVASAKGKRGKKWDEDEFFKVGKKIVSQFMEIGRKYNLPLQHNNALDFGCGAGRLVRHSCKHFESLIAVDISQGMIDLAQRYNKEAKNITYYVNSRPNLNFVQGNSMDLVYTFHVLQHIPKKRDRISFLQEFQRILKVNGLLVFHIPTFIPFRNRLQVKRRIFSVLNTLGINSNILINNFGLYPIHMKSLSSKEIERLFSQFKMVEKIEHVHKNGQVSVTFYFTKVV